MLVTILGHRKPLSICRDAPRLSPTISRPLLLRPIILCKNPQRPLIHRLMRRQIRHLVRRTLNPFHRNRFHPHPTAGRNLPGPPLSDLREMVHMLRRVIGDMMDQWIDRHRERRRGENRPGADDNVLGPKVVALPAALVHQRLDDEAALAVDVEAAAPEGAEDERHAARGDAGGEAEAGLGRDADELALRLLVEGLELQGAEGGDLGAVGRGVEVDELV